MLITNLDTKPRPADLLGAAAAEERRPQTKSPEARVPGAEVHAAPQAGGQDQPGGAGHHRQPARARRSAPGADLADRRRADAAQLARKTADQRRGAGRSLRPGAARAAAAGPDHLRHSGEHLQAGLRRAQGSAGADQRHASATTSTCCASSTRSSARWAAASTNRRPWWTRA